MLHYAFDFEINYLSLYCSSLIFKQKKFYRNNIISINKLSLGRQTRLDIIDDLKLDMLIQQRPQIQKSTPLKNQQIYFKKNKLQREKRTLQDQLNISQQDDKDCLIKVKQCVIQKFEKLPKSYSTYSRNSTQLNLIIKKQHLLINNIRRNQKVMKSQAKQVVLHQIDLNKATRNQYQPESILKKQINSSIRNNQHCFPKFKSLKRSKCLILGNQQVKLVEVPAQTAQRLLNSRIKEQKNLNDICQKQNNELINNALMKNKQIYTQGKIIMHKLPYDQKTQTAPSTKLMLLYLISYNVQKLCNFLQTKHQKVQNMHALQIRQTSSKNNAVTKTLLF